MLSALLTHPTGLSLLSFDSADPGSTPSPRSLALPSRFPKGAQPRLTVSPSSGHGFLWTGAAGVVWEYDTRGRRVGEMSVGKGITALCALGRDTEGGMERVVVGFKDGEVKIMERHGKWGCGRSFRVEGEVCHIAGNSSGTKIAVSTLDRIWLVDLLQATTAEIPLPDQTEAQALKIAFYPSGSQHDTLLAASSRAIHVFRVSDGDVQHIQPLENSARGIVDMAVSGYSPSEGEAGRCAVLGEGGRLALLSLATLDSPGSTFEFGQDMASISLAQDGSICGVASSGKLLLHDPRSANDRPREISLDEPIQSIHHIPMMRSHSSRPSISASVISTMSASRRSTILGESRAGNAQTPPPPVPPLQLDKVKFVQPHPRKSGAIPRSQSETVLRRSEIVPGPGTAQRGSGLDHGPTGARAEGSATRSASAVHARPRPDDMPSRRSSAQVGIRRTSMEVVEDDRQLTGRPPQATEKGDKWAVSDVGACADPVAGPSRCRTLTPISAIAEEDELEAVHCRGSSTSRLRPQAAVVFQEVEVEVDEELHLEWAISRSPQRPSDAVRNPTPALSSARESAEVSTLRRELARTQLDILRMNRDIKNEIRLAILPLVERLDEQADVISRQQKEIERLRMRI